MVMSNYLIVENEQDTQGKDEDHEYDREIWFKNSLNI